jgi:hypothetical protein
MALTTLGSIFVTVISGFILFLAIRFYLRHEKKWKQQDLMAMEIKSLVYALCNINHGIGDEFKPLFHEELKRQMEQRKFIDDVK